MFFFCCCFFSKSTTCGPASVETLVFRLFPLILIFKSTDCSVLLQLLVTVDPEWIPESVLILEALFCSGYYKKTDLTVFFCFCPKKKEFYCLEYVASLNQKPNGFHQLLYCAFVYGPFGGPGEFYFYLFFVLQVESGYRESWPVLVQVWG